MLEKEYIFYGKHADMVKKLTGKLDDVVNRAFFRTNYEVYRIAPIIGVLYNRRADIDKSTDSTTKVFGDKMRDENDDVIFNYRCVMLYADKSMPQDEKIRTAFRLDENDEERKQYETLFNSYVLGGVEKLYDTVFGEGNSIDEYIMNLYEFVEEFYERWYRLNDA